MGIATEKNFIPAMQPRERVRAALNHQEPDRVPLALGGGPYGVTDELYVKLLDHLGLDHSVKPFRQGHNISYMDDRLLEKIGTDIRYVWPTLAPNSPIHQTDDPDTLADSFGQPWKRAFPYYCADTGILCDKSIDDIDRLVTWHQPDPGDCILLCSPAYSSQRHLPRPDRHPDEPARPNRRSHPGSPV